ncbi:MAG: DUF2309 domain-containing protein [Lentisphaeraceae bacterium]|nr:DUF2309 domain-containing protein [Lentisphaeraceae bacterium]
MMIVIDKAIEVKTEKTLSEKVVTDQNKIIENSWNKTGPFWPLRNLAAVNPISGFEDQPFEEALKNAQAYFQQEHFPEFMETVNRHTIKWLQAFFDEGQSTISMPMRNMGLLKSCQLLMRFDTSLCSGDKGKSEWLNSLSEDPKEIISECLNNLKIPLEKHEEFLTLMLTTLPGWAAYIKYRTDWADEKDNSNPNSVSKEGYMALRLMLTCLLWSDAAELLSWHEQILEKTDVKELYCLIKKNESSFRKNLFEKLDDESKFSVEASEADAQLAFCIDVRSEPFRKSLEAQGKYETLGFAGFFGVPVSIEDEVSGSSHSSCPVLLKPAHKIVEKPIKNRELAKKGFNRSQNFKRLYQSVKYNFTTPFSLVETVGLWSGLMMGLRSIAPQKTAVIGAKLKSVCNPSYDVSPKIDSIPFEQQVSYGANALKLMGLTRNFSRLVVFCGHGSSTKNNAYETALDCGACGGRHGAPNARILSSILNRVEVRKALEEQGICITQKTWFLAAEHNTTTDEVVFYDHDVPDSFEEKLNKLKKDLSVVRTENCKWRSGTMGMKTSQKTEQKIQTRSQDWAQVRPEWGLAGNAAFIIGARSLTKGVDLAGRSFLHSYDWQDDKNGSLLTTILTAPMVVTQWINAQYFFSTLNNTSYGSGSKVTQNITGKVGVMQGNASDLMHGLPLQSVNKSDTENYHECLRLSVVVHAPKSRILKIVKEQEILQKLFGNGWVHLTCLDPETAKFYDLDRDLSWQEK